MNISGVRDGLGLDYVNGFKPLGNCQKLLTEIVTRQAVRMQEIDADREYL